MQLISLYIFIDREKNTNLRAEWNENLEEASWKKRIKQENDIIKGELRMAAKATLAVCLFSQIR